MPTRPGLLLRTGKTPLCRTMRRLLTGHAGAFNRRHRRKGHLFQNRYRSILCEDEPYFLELVRYLHLNPLRAGVVRDLLELETYPYCGHSALVGEYARPWQETDKVLSRFGSREAAAVEAYRAFVAEGARQGRRPDLMGGGLVRSAGGWRAVASLRRGRETYRSDERILGSSAFVERILREMEEGPRGEGRAVNLNTLGRRIAKDRKVSWRAMRGPSRVRPLSEARAALAYTWVRHLGRSGMDLARALRVTPQAVYAAIALAEKNPPSASELARWTR